MFCKISHGCRKGQSDEKRDCIIEVKQYQKKQKEKQYMGHQIEYYSAKVTTEKNLKLFISSITGNAYDPRESGGYHGNLTIHKDKVYKDYHEAIEAIKKYDSGWYSDHIVMYYDISAKGRAKVTEWEKKRDDFIETHSIHQRSSAYIGCPECGSKLYLGYIKGEKCPLCNTDLRPKSTIEKIKWYDKKTKECRNKNKEKCWLAKIEWHS